jgi:hypothetical protein
MNPKLAITLLMVGALMGCQSQERGNNSFVGTWNLVSWVATSPSGEESYPYGQSPEGQLIYTTDGQMSAQLMNPSAALPDLARLSQDEVMGLVLTTFIAYYGTYSIDESAQTVTHHVVGSVARPWIGTDQLREFEFLSDDRLRLTARLEGDTTARDIGAAATNELVWERAP